MSDSGWPRWRGMVVSCHGLTARQSRPLPRTPRPGHPLALANAWDVASARVVAATGAPAVATTSAGVAWAFGAPDGDQLDRAEALALIRRVADAVDVP